MHILTQKTTQETVSMRIITLVTLFFLPGTFISVSLLAMLMSLEYVSHFRPLLAFAAVADFSSPPDDYEYRYCKISDRFCGTFPKNLSIGRLAVVSDYLCSHDAVDFRRMVWRLLVGKSD